MTLTRMNGVRDRVPGEDFLESHRAQSEKPKMASPKRRWSSPWLFRRNILGVSIVAVPSSEYTLELVNIVGFSRSGIHEMCRMERCSTHHEGGILRKPRKTCS